MKQQVVQYSTALEMADGIDIPYVLCASHVYSSPKLC